MYSRNNKRDLAPKILLKLIAFTFFFVIPFLGICQVPYPKWVDGMGGSGDSKTTGLAVDKQSNVYIAGYFRGTIDLDPSSAVKSFNSQGDADIYVAKYTTTGTLIWAVTMGGNDLDLSNSLALDINGNVTITGQYQSYSFDANPGAAVFSLVNAGGDDTFVIHLDTNGGFLWAKSLGGSSSDRGEDVATDSNGNIVVALIYQNQLTLGTTSYTSQGNYNGLLVKWDQLGNLLWAFSLGSINNNQIRGLSIDNLNNVIISGTQSGPVNYNPLGAPNVVNTSPSIFLAKYTPGGTLVWVKNINGTVSGDLSCVATDTKNNVYISGAFSGSTNFGGKVLSAAGAQDVFIAKYLEDGTFTWVRDIGGAGSVFLYRFTADKDNNLYCAGYFDGKTDFNADPLATDFLTDHGQRDLYLAKYDENGNYKWAFNAGTSNCNSTLGIEIAIDANRDILLGGSFCSTVDFDPSSCTVKTLTSVSFQSDSFAAKYSQDAANITNPQILDFTIPQQIGATVIDKDNAKITLTMPTGSNLSNLTPSITLSNNTTVTPLSGVSNNFTGPVNYVVTNNCQNITYTVTISTIPNTTPVKQISGCPGNVNLLSGDEVTGTNVTFAWQILQSGTWVNSPGENNLADYSASGPPNTTGSSVIYSYRRNLTNQGSTLYDSYYDVTVNPSTDNNVISTTNSFKCEGDSSGIIFTGNVPSGFTNNTAFSWEVSTDNLTWASIANATNQELTYTQQITGKAFFRRVSATGSCIAYSNVLQISSTTAVTPANAGLPIEVCAQSQVTLNGNQPALGEIGTWTVVSPIGYAPFNPTNQNNPRAIISNFPSGVEIKLKWSIVKQACGQQSESEVSLTNNVTPDITSFSFPQQNYAAVINQAAHTINVEVSSKADIKRLTPAITISNGTISPASASEQDFTNDVIYHLTSTCGVADYRVTVKVAVPIVMKICQTEQNILIPASLISGATYQWQRYSNGTWQSTGLSGTNSSYIAPVSTGSAEIVDSYRRQVTVSNIISYDNYTDVYNEPSILNNLVTADKQTICSTGDKTLNITGNIPGGNSVIYQWQSSTDNNAWATITGATQKDLQINFTSTVSLYYRRLANNSTCNAISNVVKVDYSGPVTVANAGSSQSGCDKVSITLNANIPASSETGTWTVVSPSSYSPFNSTSVHDPKAILNNFPQDIDVLLKWTITKTDCNQQSESTINLHSVSSPTVNAGTDKYIEPGESVTLHADISSSNSYSYQWSPATGLNNPSLKDPVAKPTETTTYTLTALADNGNCEKTDIVTVFVNNTLEAPNAFTPNGDGYNDIWNIKNINSYKKVSVTIMNRWGNQIYYSNGYAKPWDGTFNGKKVTPGTYYYIIDVTDTHTKKSGSITVIY